MVPQRRETVASQKKYPNQATTAKQTATGKPTAAKPAAAKSAGPKSASARPAVKPQKTPVVTPEERQNMIAEEAYLIAEQRGFQGDRELSDWLQAEAIVDARFEARH